MDDWFYSCLCSHAWSVEVSHGKIWMRPLGELFRQVAQDSHELTISERIWQAILEFVAAITKVFSIDDEEVIDALVNESDELAHICELYQCKMAS